MTKPTNTTRKKNNTLRAYADAHNDTILFYDRDLLLGHPIGMRIKNSETSKKANEEVSRLTNFDDSISDETLLLYELL